MPKNSSARSSQTLRPESIQQRMKLYSVAATAAGVSILALAQPAEGEVIVTKKNIPINAGRPVFVDLNHDGIADFELSLAFPYDPYLLVEALSAFPLTGGNVVGRSPSSAGAFASALVRGAKIGPSADFYSSGHGDVIELRDKRKSPPEGPYYYGKWYAVGSDRFVGVRFPIKGETHYGWIRLSVDIPGNFSSKITGFAYETIPNKTIKAGIASTTVANVGGRKLEKRRGGPSLGMLADGASGLGIWRRE